MMYWSRLFIPTLREGDRLLERAGYTRPLGAGSYLFLGRRSLRKIMQIVREELDSIGAQEVYVPEGHAMADLARELRSYRQLPQIWYQFHAGLEACSFDASLENLEERYRSISQAFHRIFQRCGVEFAVAGSFSGVKFTDPEGDLAPELFPTPGRKTIAELAEFTGLPETSHMKSLIMMAGATPVLAVLRGDHQLSEDKLKRVLRVPEVRPANAEEIRRLFGASAGSLGPVGVSGVRILVDDALRGRRNMIAGANKDDYHLRHVTPGEDFGGEFGVEFFDLRRSAEGDEAVHDGETWHVGGSLELAWLTHYRSGTTEPVAAPHHAGRYGIRIDRLLWAAAEQHHDEDGLVLPASIAPVDVIVTPVNFGVEAQRKTAVEIAAAAETSGLDVLLDDRDERPGLKFKDADLIGAPWRVTVGKKVEQGLVEIVDRRSKQRTDVPVGEAVVFLSERMKA
jgi:prolyl-tRNA synthetase